MSRPARLATLLHPLCVRPYPVPNDGLGFGVPLGLRQVKNLILHMESRYCVDPKKGLVYGRAGVLIGCHCKDGYVRCNGFRQTPGTWYAHRLVWEAAKGPIPTDMEIDHLDGNKSNNRLSNLEVVTPSLNMRRAYASGQVARGQDRAASKLTDELVCQIRGTPGVTDGDWADELGIHYKTVRMARTGTTWKHVRCRGRSVAPARTTRRRPRK